MNGTLSRFARWLVGQCSRLLQEDRERHEEQWLADLEDRTTSLKKLRFALGLLRASLSLRGELSSHPQPLSLTAAEWLVLINLSPDDVDLHLFYKWLRQSPEHFFELVTLEMFITRAVKLLQDDRATELNGDKQKN